MYDCVGVRMDGPRQRGDVVQTRRSVQHVSNVCENRKGVADGVAADYSRRRRRGKIQRRGDALRRDDTSTTPLAPVFFSVFTTVPGEERHVGRRRREVQLGESTPQRRHRQSPAARVEAKRASGRRRASLPQRVRRRQRGVPALQGARLTHTRHDTTFARSTKGLDRGGETRE